MTKNEKLSDRFEIRLPYTKKQAFIEACENQSDTPSAAVRRFINSYIKRAKRDGFNFSVHRFKQKTFKYWVPISGAFIASITLLYLGALGISIYKQNAAMKLKASLFESYDINRNGLLDIGEILESDEPIHRVLDIDKNIGISLEEFRSEGKMLWMWGKNKDGTPSSPGLTQRVLVNFDLQDTENIAISSYALIEPFNEIKESAERLVIWNQTTQRAGMLMENITIKNDDQNAVTFTFDVMTSLKNGKDS